MVSEEKRSYNGGAGTAAAAAAAATMTGGGGGGPDAHHLHQRAMSNASSMSVSAMSASASGMSPMPPASTAPGGHPGAGAGGSPGGSITSQAPQPARLSVTVPVRGERMGLVRCPGGNGGWPGCLWRGLSSRCRRCGGMERKRLMHCQGREWCMTGKGVVRVSVTVPQVWGERTGLMRDQGNGA